MSNFHIAILGAMPQEVGETIKYLEDIKIFNYGDLKITQGKWSKQNSKKKILISVACSGWGKVSSARVATRLISLNNQPIDLLLFTGVAGSVSKNLKQWDIVIAEKLMQHDMDARPFYDKFVIPAIAEDKILVEKKLVQWSEYILKRALENNPNLAQFGKLKTGIIATGDKFIGDKKILDEILKQIPNLLAVEMEGAAVAQVAFQEKIPFLIVRTISDNADDKAALSFENFLNLYKVESWKLIEILLLNLDHFSF